jgi:cell division protein FtsW
VVLTLLLLSFGLVTLYSASSVLALKEHRPDTWYVLRQAGGAAVGVCALAGMAVFPYRLWARLAWPIYWAAVALVVVVVLPWTHGIAPEINGARRWLHLGVTIQPSEFAKIAMIVWTAQVAVKKSRSDHFRSLSLGLGPFFLMWCVLLIPVAVEPDLSTAVLIALLGVLVVFAAGARLGHFVFVGVAAAPLLWHQLGVGFRAERIAAFLDPAADPAGAGFQVRQSLVALGSGGLTGVGFGEGRQKFGFLPYAHNDFIFAMVGEEWGLLGVVFLVALYLAIVMIGFRVAGRAPDLFGELLAIGVTNLIALQAVLHMAVGLGLVPPTGLALPLVSYGRSNLIVTLAALGILISVARAAPGGKGARA